MNHISLLVVEDNPADIAIVKELLAEKIDVRFEIREADTLGAALSLLSHKDFDVVLLDLSLPDSSGMNTARRVITEYPETAVIVYSGLEDEELALQAVRYGAQDYLEKKLLSPAMLFKSITYAIERKKALQEKYDILSDLALALKKIECLEGILPICVGCKKIYNDDKHWLNLEDYTNQCSTTRIVKLICPDCKGDIENNS